MEIYLISDTHIGHSKMKEYENCEDREELIILNWMNTIKEDDLVIHLGDFMFGGSQAMEDLLSELPGRKILVLGNHDSKPPQYYIKHGFDFACYEFTWRNYLFTHHPVEDTRGKINIHGHFHRLNSHHLEEYPWYDKKIHKLISMPDNNYKPIKLNL